MICCQREHGLGYESNPVLLVHVHGMTASPWDRVVSLLKEAGYPKYRLRAVELLPNADANIPVGRAEAISGNSHLLSGEFLRQ